MWKPNLVSPYTTGKSDTVSVADGGKVEGKVISGDDDKIFVQKSSVTTELATSQINSIQHRCSKNCAKLDFIGNLTGGHQRGGCGSLGRQSRRRKVSEQRRSLQGRFHCGRLRVWICRRIPGEGIVRRGASEKVILKVLHEAPATAPVSLPRR